MWAPSSRLSATRMPAMRYRFARETWEIRQARTVCLTNCRSNSEYSSPLLPRMSITLGNARRNASSTVSPLMPRLYTCGSKRSSSRRRGTLSQSCLKLFLVSVMLQLYLTEASETRMIYLESKQFSTLRLRLRLSALQHGGCAALSACQPGPAHAKAEVLKC